MMTMGDFMIRNVFTCTSLLLYIHTYIYMYDYKVEEDEVGGTCGTNGREEERV
jgi:hypothetical protein